MKPEELLPLARVVYPDAHIVKVTDDYSFVSMDKSYIVESKIDTHDWNFLMALAHELKISIWYDTLSGLWLVDPKSLSIKDIECTTLEEIADAVLQVPSQVIGEDE